MPATHETCASGIRRGSVESTYAFLSLDDLLLETGVVTDTTRILLFCRARRFLFDVDARSMYKQAVSNHSHLSANALTAYPTEICPSGAR
jgi:hypothetical protein